VKPNCKLMLFEKVKSNSKSFFQNRHRPFVFPIIRTFKGFTVHFAFSEEILYIIFNI
jgi:hypothetical protein